MMKKLATLLLLIVVFSLKSQHPYFGGLNQHLLTLNPAFAGSNGDLRSQLSYMNRWPTLSGSLVYYYAGVDMLLGNHGIGISVFNQNQDRGALKQTKADLSYAYQFRIGDKLKIVPAIQISYFLINIDKSRLSFHSPLLAQIPYNVSPQPKHNADVSAGGLLLNRNYFLGVSFLSLTQPDEGVFGVSKRPLTMIYQGGYNYIFNPAFSANFYALYKIQQKYAFLQYGGYFGTNAFKLHLAHCPFGIWNSNALITGLSIGKRAIKVNYNVTIHFDKYGSATSHDIGLTCNLKVKKAREESDESREINCIFN